MAQCLYICAAGHSGSTLLDMLLGSHSDVASLGEITNLPMDWAINSTCTCGSPVRQCRLWTRVVSEFSKRDGLDFERNPYDLNLGPIYATVGDPRVTGSFYRGRRRLVTGMHYFELRMGLFGSFRLLLPSVYAGLRNNLFLYDVVGRELGKGNVVDSSKVYGKAVGLYLSAPHRTKIILLIRDGRAVYHSMRKRNFDRMLSLNSWYNHFRRALVLLQKHVPESAVLRVKYEDLAVDPATQLRRVCDFAGISYEPTMLNFRSMVHHNVNGNDMRFGGASEIRLDESWRSSLSDDEQAFFMTRAGWLNRELGYA